MVIAVGAVGGGRDLVWLVRSELEVSIGRKGWQMAWRMGQTRAEESDGGRFGAWGWESKCSHGKVEGGRRAPLPMGWQGDVAGRGWPRPEATGARDAAMAGSFEDIA